MDEEEDKSIYLITLGVVAGVLLFVAWWLGQSASLLDSGSAAETGSGSAESAQVMDDADHKDDADAEAAQAEADAKAEAEEAARIKAEEDAAKAKAEEEAAAKAKAEAEAKAKAEAEAAAAAANSVPTIAELAGLQSELTAMTGVIGGLGFGDSLGNPDAGPFTVFAPNNASFAAFESTISQLQPQQTQQVAGYHIVEGHITSDQLKAGATFNTLSGDVITIPADGELPGAKITQADIEASNGVVHIIEGVMVPEALAAQLQAAAEGAPEFDTLLDAVHGTSDISLVSAFVGQTALNDQIGDPEAGPFTVFAPADAAFAQAQGVLGSLGQDQQNRILGYHVVPGAIAPEDLVEGAEFTTSTGDVIRIGANGALPGGASITQEGIATGNGVIYVIDTVMVPEAVAGGFAAGNVNEIFALAPIQFAVNSAEILPESQGTLDEAIAVLTTLKEGTRFEVGGHTDSDGDAGYNLDLSQRRAESVVAYLVAGGVDEAMLKAVGYGETSLKVDPEVTNEDKQANRRIEFTDITNQ